MQDDRVYHAEQRWPVETMVILVVLAGSMGYWIAQAEAIEFPDVYNPIVYFKTLRYIEQNPWSGWLDDAWQTARSARITLTWAGGTAFTCGAALMWGGPPMALKSLQAVRGIHMLMTNGGASGMQQCEASSYRREQQQKAVQGFGRVLQMANGTAARQMGDGDADASAHASNPLQLSVPG